MKWLEHYTYKDGKKLESQFEIGGHTMQPHHLETTIRKLPSDILPLHGSGIDNVGFSGIIQTLGQNTKGAKVTLYSQKWKIPLAEVESDQQGLYEFSSTPGYRQGHAMFLVAENPDKIWEKMVLTTIRE